MSAYQPPPQPWEFGAEGLEPSQWQRPQQWDPLRRLALAILVDARACVHAHDTASANHARERAEARAWFNAHDDNGLFSFAHVCEMLEIAPEPTRRAILRTRNRHRYRRTGNAHGVRI